ncbi:MAG: HTH domain-containing protein [Haloarculaceae archaeon]
MVSTEPHRVELFVRSLSRGTRNPGATHLPRLRRVADGRDVRVDPFFETREADASLTGESYTALVLPAACLAEYRDGDLHHVAPHTSGSAVHSVADRVTALEDEHHESPSDTAPLARHR